MYTLDSLQTDLKMGVLPSISLLTGVSLDMSAVKSEDLLYSRRWVLGIKASPLPSTHQFNSGSAREFSPVGRQTSDKMTKVGFSLG